MATLEDYDGNVISDGELPQLKNTAIDMMEDGILHSAYITDRRRLYHIFWECGEIKWRLLEDEYGGVDEEAITLRSMKKNKETYDVTVEAEYFVINGDFEGWDWEIIGTYRVEADDIFEAKDKAIALAIPDDPHHGTEYRYIARIGNDYIQRDWDSERKSRLDPVELTDEDKEMIYYANTSKSFKSLLKQQRDKRGKQLW